MTLSETARVSTRLTRGGPRQASHATNEESSKKPGAAARHATPPWNPMTAEGERYDEAIDPSKTMTVTPPAASNNCTTKLCGFSNSLYSTHTGRLAPIILEFSLDVSLNEEYKKFWSEC